MKTHTGLLTNTAKFKLKLGALGLNHRVSIERKSPYRESYTVNSH